MKSYPSINGEFLKGVPVYVFDKLDGNNIRAEWSRKHKRFIKFGSRNVLIAEDDPILGRSIPLLIEKYEKSLTDLYRKEQFEEVVCFFEYYGKNSFAGQHDLNDEQTVTLFDINVYKHGMMPPNEFTKLHINVETPHILHVGNFTKQIEEQVKNGSLDGMTFEGCVCKTIKPIKNGYPCSMWKVKNIAWIQKVKEFCKGNVDLEKQLL